MGKPRAFMYVDDRAVRVNGNSKEGWEQANEYIKKDLKKWNS